MERSGRHFTRNSSVLFIGGVPKSGTTLMRVLLSTHPSVRCGPESHVIIDLLKLRYRVEHSHWSRSVQMLMDP